MLNYWQEQVPNTVELLNAEQNFGCLYPSLNMHLKPPTIQTIFNVSILTTPTKNNGKLRAKFFSSEKTSRIARSPMWSFLSLISKSKLCMHSDQARTGYSWSLLLLQLHPYLHNHSLDAGRDGKTLIILVTFRFFFSCESCQRLVIAALSAPTFKTTSLCPQQLPRMKIKLQQTLALIPQKQHPVNLRSNTKLEALN